MGPLVVINIGGASAPKPYGFRRLCLVRDVSCISILMCASAKHYGLGGM